MRPVDATDPSSPQSTLPGGDASTMADAGTSDPASSPIPSPGMRFDAFEVVRTLGSGAMGVVLLARDVELDRPVAIKLLSPRYGADSRAHARLKREAQSVARLNHPNVIAVHEVGTLGDRVYVVMEFVDGGTLRQWVAERPRAWTEIVDVYLQAAAGLAAAHAAGLVHRDFKPDNVLIGHDGRVRVSDFGLVGSIGDQGSGEQPDASDVRLTQTGAVLGTPAYMAPEQFAARPLDARADQFALCVSLFEALHGQRPYAGDDVLQLWRAIESGAIQPPTRPDVPPSVHAAIVRGLAVDPAARHPSMVALAQALAWRPAPVPKTSPATLAAAIAAAAVLGLGGIGTLAWWLSRGDEPASASATASAQNRPAASDQVPARLCDVEAEMADLWDDKARVATQTAFFATGLAFAGDAFERVAASLDRHVTELRTGYADACSDAPIDEDLRARRRHCLDTTRDALRATLEVLGRDPTPLVVQSSPAVVGELPSPEHCRDPAALRLRAAPPSAEALGTNSGRELWRAHALLAAGEVEAAERVRVGVQATVDSLDYPLLHTQAALVAAHAQILLGRPAEAEPHLRAAITSARTSHDRFHEGTAMADLVHVLGAQLGRTPEALALVPQLREAFEGVLAEPRWYMHLQLATVLRAARQHAEADAEITIAIDLLTASPWPRPDMLAICHVVRGQIRAGLGRGDEAVAGLEEGLRQIEHAYGHEHPQRARALVPFANVLLGLGRHDQARTLYEEAARLLEPDVGANHADLANVLLGLGGLERAVGRNDHAVFALRRALAIREQRGETALAAVVLLEIAVVEYMRGLFDDADRALVRADEIAQAQADVPLDRVRLAQMRGAVAWAKGDVDAAIAHHERRLALLEKQLGSEHAAIAAVRVDLGELALADDDCERAKAELERALRSRARLGVAPDVDLGRIVIAQATCDLRDDAVAAAKDGVAQATKLVGELKTAGVANAGLLEPRIAMLEAELAHAKSDDVAARRFAEAALATYEAAGPSSKPEAGRVRDWIDLNL